MQHDERALWNTSVAMTILGSVSDFRATYEPNGGSGHDTWEERLKADLVEYRVALGIVGEWLGQHSQAALRAQ